MTPPVIGESTAAARATRLSGTPALARANSGTTTKLVQGCRVCVSRSAGEMVSWTCRWAGVSNPTATPAMVASTPEA